jgi:hypothetical protein
MRKRLPDASSRALTGLALRPKWPDSPKSRHFIGLFVPAAGP